ncbi:ladderlectin-like [Cheilinus undulatus]|uniref:ladderlectin-like n=1 Tax=Cheilinus undulatus TaxID=241271 RepID=UPI001BD3C4A0|nr:ladderlectin-like [Cheilinus undulatus]
MLKAKLTICCRLLLVADVVDVAGVADVEASVLEPQEDYQERFLKCPSGWEQYKGSCYLYMSSPTSWIHAETNCYIQGASLASAHDDFDYTFLQSLTSRGNSLTAWVGGYFLQGWRWVDQSRFNYNNWYSQTNPANDPCVHLWSESNRGWSNSNCNIARPFICVRNFEEC